MPFEYNQPYRTNYELRAIMGWAATIPVAWGTMLSTSLPEAPFVAMNLMAASMAVSHIGGARRIARERRNLMGFPLEFYTPKELSKKLKKNPDKIWLGVGYPWTQKHAQKAHEILKTDMNEVLPKKLLKDTEVVGSPWIHGLEDKSNEIDLVQGLEHSTLMSLIVGTTGAGKTRMFETLIAQAVLRGDAVLIFDPKGDKDMAETARRACVNAGKEENYFYFHPAFPENSVRVDPLSNYNQPSEIASRLSEIVPQGSNSAPFTAFAFMAINNIVQGLVYSGRKPNLKNITSFLRNGTDRLIIETLHIYFTHYMPDWETGVRGEMAKLTNDNAKARFLCRYYREKVAEFHESSDIEGLISMFEHDRSHFDKMITSTLPTLAALTSGDIGELLSPSIDSDDPRPIMDTGRIINQGGCMYMGLDSLSNNVVGAAIGSVFLSDLASLSGARYNYGEKKPRRVSIFVDEASEIVNKQLIQLLNKGRGANLSVYLATQTIPDFAARMGDENQALQFLGNLNNLIALRTIDPNTQEFITKNLPMTRVNYLMRTQGSNTDSGSAMLHGGNIGERLMEEEAELFAPQLLGMLPNLEFIAKLAGGKIVKGRIPILTEGKK